MGSGYNDSLAASRGARTNASTRTPVHFWLNVPVYEYDLGCGRNQHLHTFQTRTPLMSDDDTVTLLCSNCQEYREISADAEPLNQPTSNDEKIAFEQDKGVLRERIAQVIQDRGFVENDSEIAKLAVEFGVPVAEIKRLNAGLRAPDGLSGMPDMCKAGLHEMTLENTLVTNGRRKCRACWYNARRARRAKGKQD